MARPLSIEYKGVFYHTTSHGNERRKICFAKLDYGRFKEKGRRYHCQFVLIQGLTPFFLHVWFLDTNGILYAKDGRKRIGDNAFVALSLLIAESNPEEKDIIIKVIVNLVNKDN